MRVFVKHWVGVGLLVAVALLLLAGLPLLAAAQEGDQPAQIHVVQQGETAVGIAARYGVPLARLLEVNGLRSAAVAPGTRLIIPSPSDQVIIHLVRPLETLASLAVRFGVSVEEIMRANGLARPDSLFVGQRLLIPLPGAPQASPTPSFCAAGCARLSITTPARNSAVASPLRVTGQGAAFEQTLVVRVLDATGYEIGKGQARIDGPLGAVGPYSGEIEFTMPPSDQPGRVQVYSVSPADGAIERLASVLVTLQGTGLDEAVEALKRGLESQDYAALTALMSDRWQLVFFDSESMSLSRPQALRQLRASTLGPGQVFVDLSVDARSLLASLNSLPAGVTHVAFSTGWGPDQQDDAFLLFSSDARGQTRWSGMVYIFGALRPY
jgi:LysM repeat protein